MKNREFRNESLKEVSEVAKQMGLRVFTFESRSKYIEQIFFTDGEKIGTSSADYGSITFGSIHKPNRACGTGFGLEYDYNKSLIENIRYSLNCFAPKWAKRSDVEHVKKYKNVEEYLQREKILKYYFL